jgi:hypothetical protein
MAEYRYKIRGWGKDPIYRVELVSETAQFATVIDDWLGKARQVREKKDGNMFATFEEARAFLLTKYEREEEAYRRRANDARSRAGEIRKMENPYEVADAMLRARSR